MITGWDVVIGLEVHVQLLTESKLFSFAPAGYGEAPNSQVSWVDAGLPGMLPAPNERPFELAMRFGLAVGATIPQETRFARKNYFYPDLPKGYQISQMADPIVQGGQLSVDLEDGQTRLVRLERAHLEEDAGKSDHELVRRKTGIDLNRAGVPLLEVVTKPDLRSAREASVWLRKLHALVRYLDICDGNMEQGSFRCDANVSLKPEGQAELGTRVELKNINSFKFVERAIEYEVHRQSHLLTNGAKVVQETRLYDSDRNETRSMRGKETEADYRYFPDPDLPPVRISPDWIARIRTSLPELADAKSDRYQTQFGLSRKDADFMASEPAMAAYFEQAVVDDSSFAVQVSNWVRNHLAPAVNAGDRLWTDLPIRPEMLAGLVKRLQDGTLSIKLAKPVFDAMWAGEGDADAIIAARGYQQISDGDEIAATVDQVIAENPDQIAQFKAGNEKVFQYLVGQVMRHTKGRANPEQVVSLLRERLT